MAKMKGFSQRIKQRAKEAEFSGGSDTLRTKGDIGFYKPAKGKNEMIIVPFTMGAGKNLENIEPGEIWFRQQILKHFRVGPDDKAIICPRTVGKKCPICEHRAVLISQGKPTDDAEVRELTPKKRELYYILDLADDDKLKIFEVSYHNFGRKLEEEIREADDDSIVTNFADPDEGAVLTVRMNEASMGKNKYLEAGRFDFEPRNKAENKLVAEAMDRVTPFSDLLVVLSYEGLKNLFYDLSEEADSTEEDAPEEEAPRRRSAKSEEEDKVPFKSKQASSKSDEEEEEEEEEAPRRRHKAEEDEDDKPKRRKVVQETEEDEDEPEEPIRRKVKKPAVEEDEEEEAPKRKSSKKDPEEPECPGKGTFGKDCDTLDDCEDCAYWADCRDLTDEAEAAKRKNKK